MDSQLDRWRTAESLIKRHGLGAGLEAAQRAHKAIAQSDPKAAILWRDVMGKIQQLQRTKLPSEPLN